MRSWQSPSIPDVPGRGVVPRVHDTATESLQPAATGPTAALYVCGITPYDATHLGHAATYLAYDTLIRCLRDAGVAVAYAQNTTDVDDPLLERAHATGVDWVTLAESQTELFRRDMAALGIVPPDHYVAVTEVVDRIVSAVQRLADESVAYRLGGDWYFDSAAAASDLWTLGDESRLDRAQMLVLSAERGGDPDREGKRDPLDPLLWRGEREGEPSWDGGSLGAGRPGWHIECSVIASEFLGVPLDVQGGGHDLVFPHHEFSAGHTAALDGAPLARVFAHAGLLGYRGEKMSKSLGNLVFVRELLDGGTDPRVIRLALLAHHYRADAEWTDDMLTTAEHRLADWTARPLGFGDSGVDELRAILADDLDTPRALAFLDGADWTLGLATAVDALVGIRLDAQE